VTWSKGLQALHTPCCRCGCVITSSLPCRITGANGDTGQTLKGSERLLCDKIPDIFPLP